VLIAEQILWRDGFWSPFGEAGCDVVVDIGELGLKVVGLLQDLLGAFVSVLSRCHQLAARLQQWRKQVLYAHADLLLTPLFVALGLH